MISNENVKKYKKISFSCNKCGFNTNVIKNINEHVKFCTESLKIETECEKLKKLLSIERCKVAILTELLKNNSSINLSDFINTEENIVNFYNTDDLSFKIHSTTLETIPKKSSTSKKDLNRKHVYRSIKNSIPLMPMETETQNEFEIEVETVNNNIEEPFDIKKNQDDIDCHYKKLEQSRIYTKILDDIKEKRWSLFSKVNLEEYKTLLIFHIKKLEEIFTEKKYADKKIKQIVLKSLYAIEARILYYDSYFNSYIEVDEIEKFKLLLENNIEHPKELVPFDENKIYKYFLNYSIVLFPLSKLFEMFLFNKYKFNNIIYLPLAKSSLDNPYSFYTLEKIHNDKRYWKMDCRLDYFSCSLITNLSDHMIKTFRTIYKDVFGDNEYREKYVYNCQITECDLEQLLENILVLSKPKQFCIQLQKLIVKNSKYIPGDNDKFNLSGDDSLQRKRFIELEDVDGCEIYRRIFDNITIEKSIDLYRIRTLT
jgi:hypothetical protein